MRANLFIPDKINVGFQNRSDTYTKKLAYVIYYDEKGILRKEKSWESWRDKNIPNEEYDNVPTSGFVLNRKAGGHKSGWDYRQSYIRVYDPRGFEFEITVENLLYILENCNSIKGKGLEGEFIYSWNGTELVLLPVDSSDYHEIKAYNEKVVNAEKITNKSLVCGRTYRKKNNTELLYLGKYEYFNYSNESEGYKHMFAEMEKGDFFMLHEMSSVNGKFIETVSVDTPSNFDSILERLMHNRHLSQMGPKIKKDFPWEKMKEQFPNQRLCMIDVMYEEDGIERIVSLIRNPDGTYFDDIISAFDENREIEITTERYNNAKNDMFFQKDTKSEITTLKDFLNKHHAYVYYHYLANGYLYRISIMHYFIFDNVKDLSGDDMKIKV